MKKLNRNFLVELVVLSAIIVALDLLVFQGRFIGWNPSPLWVIVLLIAMRYGSPAGIIGGSVAAALHLWELTRNGYPLEELLHRNPELLTGPVLYIFVGMYLGETREHLARRADHFKAQVDDLNQKLDANEIKRMNLERNHLAMEKRIAGQADTLLGVYENLNRLGNVRSEADLWVVLSEIVQRELRADACGIWRLSPPELLAVTGALAEEPPPLASLAVKKRGVATVADWAEARGSEPPGAELAGLVVEDQDRPVVMVVSGMGFGRLNRNAVIIFDLVMQRAGLVIQHIRHLNSLRQASVSDPELGLGSESYLRNRIREQTLLAKRHQTPLSILCCAYTKEPPPHLAERLEVILACSIRAAVRASDGIAYFGDRKAFVVMLPQSDLAGVDVVVRKIASNLETLDIRDDEERPILGLKWNALIPSEANGSLYEQLFGGMKAREEVAT